MHPKQICDDFKSLCSPFVLDGDELFIDNPENIYPELEELAKSYKARIVAFLKGNYSDQDHAVKQTIDKIIKFYCGIDQDMNEKINNWLNNDAAGTAAVMQLLIDLNNNGWDKVTEPICNFENDVTDKLSKEIFERAMAYFKKGA
ncbi:hypothetical protein [Peribacillus sp. R9-11]|uniref:hypothetical protein n=1 Tax=Peribacillus sp. R9-11 TaxID=3073271 RepID=UPI002868A588|nr:hypothetical protein [Peribacillus sp. R9-11]WMX57425.1 hypothetical protein RE409_09490 [Peribacillus sp. R9-11]